MALFTSRTFGGKLRWLVPGAGFEPATSGLEAFGPFRSPDYESGALARLGYPGFVSLSAIV